jgi:hypothetical protein
MCGDQKMSNLVQVVASHEIKSNNVKSKKDETSSTEFLKLLQNLFKSLYADRHPIFHNQSFMAQVKEAIPNAQHRYFFEPISEFLHIRNIIERQDSIYLQLFMKHFKNWPSDIKITNTTSIRFIKTCLQYNLPIECDWGSWLTDWKMRFAYIELFRRASHIYQKNQESVILQEEKQGKCIDLCREFLCQWSTKPELPSFMKKHVLPHVKESSFMKMCCPFPKECKVWILKYGFPSAKEIAVPLLIYSYQAKQYDVFQFVQSTFRISLSSFLNEAEWKKAQVDLPEDVATFQYFLKQMFRLT